MIKTVQNLYSYVEGSAKRHHLFQHIQDTSIQTTLKELCVARWHHRYNSFKAIKKAFSALITFLSIQGEELTAACDTSASVLLAKIQNISFVFHLELMYSCFKIINSLSEFLQSVDIDVMRAQQLYKATVNSLTEMKSDTYYQKFHKSVMEVISFNGIDAETKHGKKRGRRSNVPVNSEDEFKVTYCSIIDSLVKELDFRFKEDNIRPLVVIHKLITEAELDR